MIHRYYLNFISSAYLRKIAPLSHLIHPKLLLLSINFESYFSIYNF